VGEAGSETKPPESIYKAVLPVLLKALGAWKTPGDLAEELNVRKAQLNDWIRRAVDEGLIEKKNRPVRYHRK
jgi:DNA-binding MarR family transcriptional regulator